MNSDKTRIQHTKGKRFAPHGQLELEFKARYIIYHCTGPFNKEMIEAAIAAHSDALNEFISQGPWAGIAIYHNDAMLTEEALQVMRNYLQQMKAIGRAPVASAYVLPPDLPGTLIMAPAYLRLHQELGLSFRLFARLEDAELWTQQELAAADSAS